MVTLFQRFSPTQKPPSRRMKHHHESESLSASFRAFEAEILSHLYQLSLHSKVGVQTYSFSWLHKCLSLVSNIDRAFAKFTVEIDYPVKEWRCSVVEEYLKDNLSLLDHLNCISSSISHMSQTCMKLRHASSLVEASPHKLNNLQGIVPWCSKLILEDGQGKEEENVCSEKERIVLQALLVRMSVKTWLCRVIDSGICGDVEETCTEMGKDCRGFYNTPLATLLFAVCEEMKKKGILREVSEVNQGVLQVLAAAREGRYSEEANKLGEKVEVLGKLLEGIKMDVNRLFSESMVRRNELLDRLRNEKQ